MSDKVPGFTLVVAIQILADGSHHEWGRIFTDGMPDLEEVKNGGSKYFDWDERHYSFVNGEWTED